jgi:hypothetical protein
MLRKLIATLAFGACAAGAAHAAPVAINFDGTGAPCVFAATAPLTSLYAGQGVTFSGVNGASGSILNQCGSFGFNARSGTDFYAYNTNLTGSVFDLAFSSMVSTLSIWGATGSGGTFTLEAFDASNVSLGLSSVSGSTRWQQLSINTTGIAWARLSGAGGAGAFDDLSFENNVRQVPEPLTLGLVAIGLLGVAATRQRRA